MTKDNQVESLKDLKLLSEDTNPAELPLTIKEVLIKLEKLKAAQEATETELSEMKKKYIELQEVVEAKNEVIAVHRKKERSYKLVLDFINYNNNGANFKFAESKLAIVKTVIHDFFRNSVGAKRGRGTPLKDREILERKGKYEDSMLRGICHPDHPLYFIWATSRDEVDAESEAESVDLTTAQSKSKPTFRRISAAFNKVKANTLKTTTFCIEKINFDTIILDIPE